MQLPDYFFLSLFELLFNLLNRLERALDWAGQTRESRYYDHYGMIDTLGRDTREGLMTGFVSSEAGWSDWIYLPFGFIFYRHDEDGLYIGKANYDNSIKTKDLLRYYLHEIHFKYWKKCKELQLIDTDDYFEHQHPKFLL